MPLGSSSEAPVIRPGPIILRSFGRSGLLELVSRRRDGHIYGEQLELRARDVTTVG
jgi:hypothetical protein